MKTADRWRRTASEEQAKRDYLAHVESWEEKIHSFLEYDFLKFPRPESDSPENGGLAGIPFGVKDNIAVNGFKLSCGSKMLENLISPYNATAIEKLLASGAVPVGKTNLDEFGMGSSTDNSALAQTNNPWDLSRVSGGSSGGSAAAVAAGLVPFALGSDTGGSVRQPAAFCGVYGLKPTYGSVSRFGLVAYASSLEVIGVLSADVDTAREVFHVIQGEDERDQTSIEYSPLPALPGPGSIGVLKGDLGLDEVTAAQYAQTIKRFESLGYTIKEIEMKTQDYVVPAYYTIATAEASANLARFNGIRYGYRPEWAENPDELVRLARQEGFGDEVKSRILLGTFVLRSGFQDQYYTKAQKIRTAIRMDLDAIYEDVDLILMPVFPTQAFSHGDDGLDPFQQKVADRFTVTANLAGIPAFSFPVAVENGLPVGMQLMAPAFGEERLFQAVEQFEAEVFRYDPPESMRWW